MRVIFRNFATEINNTHFFAAMKTNKWMLTVLLMLLFSVSTWAQSSFKWKVEKLTRGVVAVPRSSACNGFMVSWRLLASDDEYTTFDVLRNDKTVTKDLNTVTSYWDASGRKGNTYRVVTKHHGVAVDTSAVVTPWDDVFFQLHMNKPADGERYGYPHHYYPNDCSCADVDGDGEYEIICKWVPSNQADNSQFGFTGETIIDCYKLDGTQLWRINLGVNIRSGAHYTQFLVYDFDGDGKAEMICKTAPGSLDGTGKYVSEAATEPGIRSTDNTKDYTYLNTGFVVNGPEYLTVFSGETGEALHTIFYNPNRGCSVGGDASLSPVWGDEYGNRVDRFLACVAYLKGGNECPSAVMCRGYYSRCYVWAVDFDGKELSTWWRHASTSEKTYMVTDHNNKVVTKVAAPCTYPGMTSNTAFANGNHNISVADVDDDGCDEIILGSATIDHDGYMKYTTGLGHGDALHVGDILPDHPGLEVMMVHEGSPLGFDVHDAATGEILLCNILDGDIGRGMAADVNPNSRGYEIWSWGDSNMYAADGSVVGNSMSFNFRIYWDGDLQDELLSDIGNHNQPFIEKFGVGRVMVGGKNVYATGYSTTCNGSKGSPCLTADLFGDWREEMIFYNGEDDCTLNIYSTAESTSARLPTLMSDHVYRMGIAWQNVAYNQPPHLGYYLPDSVHSRITCTDPTLKEQHIMLGDSIEPIRLHFSGATSISAYRSYQPDGSTRYMNLPIGMKGTRDLVKYDYCISGVPTMEGKYEIVVRTSGDMDGTATYDTLYVHVSGPTGVQPSTAQTDADIHTATYDLMGRQLRGEGTQRGIVIRNRKKYIQRI